jgi:uncharacterized protein (TIGR03790 family)
MKRMLAIVIALLGAFPLRAANPGDEVIVIYNSRLPESRAVADYYAARRNVPTNQVFGFDLPTTEDISRSAFRDALQKPLARLLEQQKLWHIASHFVTDTNNTPSRVEWRPSESKIRYAVLCYGVPLHIPEDPTFSEPVPDKLIPELRRNEAAVDSELALLPLIEQSLPITGPLRNWAYTATATALLHPTNGLLLVARLDGPTPEIARGLVDKALAAEADGLWGRAYFDLRDVTGAAKLGDDWIRAAAEISRLSGFETTVDTNAATFSAAFPLSHVALYAGWYDGDASGPFSLPTVEFMPGAFAYHLHSFSAATLRSPTRHWVGPLLAKGATCSLGCVAEPYLACTPDIGTFFGRFLVYGFTFGEAAYACQSYLSWQNTVVGDPLYRPFGKSPQVQHQDLERRHSPLVEWSHLKVANLSLAKQAPVSAVTSYLEDIDTTRHSAVLTEKLADLYAGLGKPLSSIRAYRQALDLNPSPQQRLRLRLALGEQLLLQNRDEEARDNYRKLLDENPAYAGRTGIANKVDAIEGRLTPPASTNAPAR